MVDLVTKLQSQSRRVQDCSSCQQPLKTLRERFTSNRGNKMTAFALPEQLNDLKSSTSESSP